MNYKKSYPLPKNTQVNKNQCEPDVLPRYDQPTHVLNVNQRHIVRLEKLDYTFKIPCLPSQFAKWNFFIFQKRDTPKKFQIYIRKRNFLIILQIELGEPKKKKTLLRKNFLLFVKWGFLAPSLKNVLYFRRELAKPENQTKSYSLELIITVFNYYHYSVAILF